MKNINFRNDAINLFDELVELRRSLHRIPEVGFKEHKTSKFIQGYLKDKLNIPYKTGMAGGTGIVAILEGCYPGPTIAVRADMDGLPIEEQTGLYYSSINPGFMHACGHDGHMAIVLGTVKLLSKYKSQLKGNVKFIFQPAEELGLGAKKMIDSGVLEKPKVDAILGFHIWPELEKCKIGIKDGVIMASGDRFDIEVIGKGCHGAEPYKAIDPVIVSARIISAIQTIVSREVDVLKNAVVVSIGILNGGTAFNVIPERVNMSGTVRTTDAKIQKRIPQSIERITKGISEAHNTKFMFDYKSLFPLTVNDRYIAKTSYRVLRSSLGEEKVEWLQYPGIVSEDFSQYLALIPGMYFFIGAKEKDKHIELHSPNYNFDESVLVAGVEALSTLVYDFLNNEQLDKMSL